ncbi:hypothetical protein DFH06DRAFT_1294473 [Mycena polygramma]|nr:hypothetical protein DFH06DRAFT_1294473 [Mycena polygramma]
MPFFEGATNFKITGGTFNAIAGDLNRYDHYHSSFISNTYNEYPEDVPNYQYHDPYVPGPPRGRYPAHHRSQPRREQGPYGYAEYYADEQSKSDYYGGYEPPRASRRFEASMQSPGHMEISGGEFIEARNWNPPRRSTHRYHTETPRRRSFVDEPEDSMPSSSQSEQISRAVPDNPEFGEFKNLPSDAPMSDEDAESAHAPDTAVPPAFPTAFPSPVPAELSGAQKPLSTVERMRMRMADMEIEDPEAVDTSRPSAIPSSEGKQRSSKFGNDKELYAVDTIKVRTEAVMRPGPFAPKKLIRTSIRLDAGARVYAGTGITIPLSLSVSSAMPPMTQYSSVAGPNAAAIDATFDISATVLATLTTAAEFAPLPFLQQASIFALAILNTVRGAKDNKESFKALANDACELVSAIICVYNDMQRDGQTPSLGLKKHVEELVALLKGINQFAQKHVARSTFQRIVRLQTETAKIQQYRGRLRQALDLQSSISIHETVVQILQELREREPQAKDGESGSSSPPLSPPPPSVHPFGNLLHGNITGNIRINNIAGNQEIHSTRNYTTYVDSYNNRRYSSRSQSWGSGNSGDQ